MNIIGNVNYVGNEFKSRIYTTGHIKSLEKCPRCPICYPRIAGYSNMEKELVDFCKQHFPNLIENDRKLINPYELDIVIPEKKIAIEFNGDYWHSLQSKRYIKGYHLMKTELCEAQGYQLIHIFEYQWKNEQEKILSFLDKLFTSSFIFTEDELLLDRRFYKLDEIQNYELISIIEPTIEKVGIYDIENCGFIKYKKRG
jgi:very-short-patch-repair endonuclease